MKVTIDLDEMSATLLTRVAKAKGITLEKWLSIVLRASAQQMSMLAVNRSQADLADLTDKLGNVPEIKEFKKRVDDGMNKGAEDHNVS